MVDPFIIATQVVSIGNVIYQAVKLFEALKAAPDEFNTAALHVHSLSIVLESVRSDLVDNPCSVVNTPNILRQTKRTKLAHLINNCDKSLQKVEAVLKKYKGLQRSAWIAWRWSSKGKQEIDSIHADLLLQTLFLNLFLASENRESLSKIGTVVEDIRRALERLSAGGHSGNNHDDAGHRNDCNQRKRPSVGGAIFAGLFISRLKTRLKKNKQARKRKVVQRPNSPKPIVRVRTLPPENKRRNTLLAEYVETLTKEEMGDTSNSNQEKLECWLIAEGQYFFGGPTIYHRRQIKRGQMQIKEMAKQFESAGKGSTCDTYRNHSAVKWILREKNSNGSRYRWTLAAAVIESSSHGMTRTKKVRVILRRLPKQ